MTEEEQITIFESILVEDAKLKPLPMSRPVDNGVDLTTILKEFEKGYK